MEGSGDKSPLKEQTLLATRIAEACERSAKEDSFLII